MNEDTSRINQPETARLTHLSAKEAERLPFYFDAAMKELASRRKDRPDARHIVAGFDFPRDDGTKHWFYIFDLNQTS